MGILIPFARGGIPKLRVVVLERPWDCWDREEVRNLFMKILTLKLSGYRREHPYGVLPVDGTDFVATHVLVCEETPAGELEPLMGYRSIDLATCDTFQLTFPALAVASSSGARDHVTAIEGLIDEARRSGKHLRYCSSYTVRPEIRENRTVPAPAIRELLGGTHLNFIRSSGTEISVMCGVVRFHIDELFKTWGYAPIQLGDRKLPSFRQKSLLGDEVVMFTLPGFSPLGLELIERYRGMWESRLHIRSESKDGGRRAA